MSYTTVPFYSPEESLRLIMGKWKLTGQNYPVWKLHFDNVLRGQDKLYVINKPLSRPKSNAPEEEFAEYFRFMADESDVMSILSFSASPEFTVDLRVKFCHEVVKGIENQIGFYKNCGKYLIMKEIFSLKLKRGQSVKDHLLEIRRLFKCLSRLGYKMTQEELVYLMWFSLPKEIRVTASGYMGEPKMDVAKVHEDILDSLEPKEASADLMDSTDWIDELGDLSCPECGSQDICVHSFNVDQMDIGVSDAPGIFMIDCLITSYESWVLDTGSGNHICNHLQGFTRRETLRKDRSNLRVGEGTMLVAEAVGSYSLSLPSGLVLELDTCYYVPKMIKNVLSFDLLVDQGFYYKYDYKMISCFKNDMFYFKATPSNGLYILNLQESNNEIYHISKRSKDIEDQTYLWHCRLGHINKKRVELLQKGGLLGTFDFKPFSNCESCLSGKMTKHPFNKDNERANDLLEIIHTDVCGPFSHEARGGYRYFITFTDDFSRYGYVYLIRHKSEAFEKFKEFQSEVQNQLDRKIKFLRSDRGGEYLSLEFDSHLRECGIVSQLTPPYTPQMNGVSERRNRTLLDMVRSMMCRSTLPVSFWGHVLVTAANILNKVPTKSVEKTPYELWTGKKPKLSFLKIWGCEVYVKRTTSEKLKPKSDKCFFVGYPKNTLGYYFYNPSENKVFVARNGEFLEEKFLSQENTRNDIDLQVVEEETPEPIVEPVTQQGNVETQPETVEEVQTQNLRRSTRIRQEPDRYLGFLVSQDGGDLNEPTSYGEAVSGDESEQWQEAMKAEMQSMYDNQVWELTDLPQHCRAVGRKWVFKKKTDMDGNVHTFKARLVAKGFTQTHGIDYDETFSPVAMLKSIRILMAISAYFDYEIWQMDVKTAFLNGKLTEDVYMQQPEGFVDPKNPNKVCKLLKSIYGLKQASRSWNLHFDERIKEFGFAKSEFEPCVYTKFSGSIVTFLVLYVDDILLIGNDIPTLQSVKAWLSKCFQMKDLGEAAYIRGIKIYRNRSRRLIGLSQGTYIDKILKRFRMDESKKGFIPMQHGIVLSKAQCPESSQDKDKMKSIPYASAIGSIMYAMLCTRPDVAYSVSVTSRYQQNPGEAHWVAVKNILKYLRRTKEMFLVFGGSEDEISVTGYSDASFQTDRDDYRSQSGYVFTLNGGAISWKSSKQDTIADSTTEAEYIAASDAAKEAVWLRNFITDLRVVASISRPVDIYCDNSGAVAQAKEPREHHKSRHVLRKFHLIREIIGRGDVRICKIPTDENVADPLTKPLARVKHETHANSIGMQYLDTTVPPAGDQPGIPARELVKPVTDWNDEDRRLVNIDTKARSLIAMPLPDDVFHSVCHLRSAKEIWDTLCVQYEGTAMLMESRKIFLVRQYESFIHQKDETLSQLHQRFNCLLIDLKTIGTIYPNSEKKLKKNLIRDTKDSKSTSVALVSDSVPPVTTPSSGKGHFANDCRYRKSQFAPSSAKSFSKNPKYQRLKEKYKKMKFQRKGKGLIAEDCDWDDVSSDDSSDEEDTQVALMAIIEEPTLALMAKIEEVPEEVPTQAPQASTSATESASQVPTPIVPLESLTQLDLVTLDLYKALNGKTSAEKMNIDFRDQLRECQEKIKQLTILEESYKDQVTVNQTLCIEREKALAAKERALAELNAEKVTVKGWSDASEKVDEILASGRNVKNKKGLGFTSGCPRPDRSMLKFGMFVSSIPDPNTPENIPSSSNTHTEGAPKSKKKTAKEKSKTVTPSKTKNPKPKNKVLGGGPSVLGTKSFSQNPAPRLKIDLKQKTLEKKPIPPLSNAKGILGTGPAHLKFKNFLDPTKRFQYRKCYHCGFNNHIASKCPDATKTEKLAKVKKSPKTDNSVKGKKVVKTVPSVKTPASRTDNSVKAVTNSTNPTNNSGSIDKGIWYLDSGCSRHMTGSKSVLSNYREERGPAVTFGGNGKGQTRGYGTLTNGVTMFKRVAYVEGLMDNLLSISQLCDKNHKVSFSKKKYKVKNRRKEVILTGVRQADIYIINMNTSTDNFCFVSRASSDTNWLWHKHLSHLNFKTLNQLCINNLVVGLPDFRYTKVSLCSACEKGKQTRATFKSKQISSISSPLQLLHMDLFGPVNVQSIAGKKYTLVIIDEYSRYTWVFFLRSKSEAPEEIILFVRKMERLNNLTIRSIRSDHGTEFKNSILETFFDQKGISQNFSSVRTPQQNGVGERRNITLIEAARSMLSEANLATQFWAEAVNTACYTQNRSLIVKRFRRTPYELFRNRKPSIEHLHIFGCVCYILNNKDNLGKQTIEETIHVKFDESGPTFPHPHDNSEINQWADSFFQVPDVPIVDPSPQDLPDGFEENPIPPSQITIPPLINATPITQVTPEPDQPTNSEDFSQTTVSEPAPTNLLPDPSVNEASTSGQVYQPPAL
ncbi:hypothetical protein OSB04_010904 [Centaurea solstitialis]|uniref:Uncharacterized protein n=1 Tax=Centaurea solstitialis TaxID=347529 RepID=A0AA38T8F5_9ASTR|nr:hypothetical protein OSB04_010904 [Centaurea solstitialis]